MRDQDGHMDGYAVVCITETMLQELWDDFSESDGLPAYEELTPAQQDAALRAVQHLHENIDEYHAMADAIEEVT